MEETRQNTQAEERKKVGADDETYLGDIELVVVVRGIRLVQLLCCQSFFSPGLGRSIIMTDRRVPNHPVGINMNREGGV